jgi:hypothetical protein
VDLAVRQDSASGDVARLYKAQQETNIERRIVVIVVPTLIIMAIGLVVRTILGRRHKTQK